MKLKGKYLRGITDFTDCEILIEYGKLQRIKFNSRQIFNDYIPKNSSNFDLEKVSSDPIGFIPSKHNYVINYIGQNSDLRKIYLRLNLFQLFKLRWNIKKFLVQSREIKIGILKFLLLAALSFIIGMLIQKNKVGNQNPNAPEKSESQKSFEHTNDQATEKNLKTD